MVTNTSGYDSLIEYLTENLSLFEKTGPTRPEAIPIIELLEKQLSEKIISLCTQHPELETNHRGVIIREIDGIMYDLQEVLSGISSRPATQEQEEFIEEYTGLIKNLFDASISDLLD
ncbi:DUF3802 family protein [Algicola sagamiensis]|uniref:DUF3802 family protein n=1 Tax=Algicola sagamiensis TaxID=163869 RepID=UPI000381E4FE|nr:DUF3802 family protein [Algicola sagamiensis]